MALLPDTRYSLLVRLIEPGDVAAWSEFTSIYEEAILRYSRNRGLQERGCLRRTRDAPWALQFGCLSPRDRHPQEAVNVFQACFVELVRRAASSLRQESLAGWLHTVAVRVARRTRAHHVRRPQREATGAMTEAVADEDDVSWREVRQALEEEIARLPDDLRSAVGPFHDTVDNGIGGSHWSGRLDVDHCGLCHARSPS
jgi:hypothetical protein